MSEGAGKATPWWGVHVARYRFALAQGIAGRALDVACGSGYGTELMVKYGLNATGVDLDSSAVEATKLVAPSCRASALRLPYRDECFDAVFSFETIEHLDNGSAFVGELHRVLKPYGSLVLSTPNANYTRPLNGRPSNPHHIYEYTPLELRELIRGKFDEIQLLGQGLASHVRISPFLDDQRRLPRSLTNLVRLFLWRALNRSPAVLRDRISHALWGHSVYLSDKDYRFDDEAIDADPVLVALARRAGA